MPGWVILREDVTDISRARSSRMVLVAGRLSGLIGRAVLDVVEPAMGLGVIHGGAFGRRVGMGVEAGVGMPEVRWIGDTHPVITSPFQARRATRDSFC